MQIFKAAFQAFAANVAVVGKVFFIYSILLCNVTVIAQQREKFSSTLLSHNKDLAKTEFGTG